MTSKELKVPHFEISFDTPNRDRFLRDDFQKKHDSYAILGRGSYGVVIKASYHGRPVAVKILEKRSYRHKRSYDSLMNEANALRLQHDNIVSVIKIISGTKYGLVLMEQFDGHCLQTILSYRRKRSIPLQHKLFILFDVINGLYFCHRHKIVHLDVKPQNVIVTLNRMDPFQKSTEGATYLRLRKYLCKLCDFGSSMMLESWQRNETLVNHGTIRYMAPELLCGQQCTKGGVTERADIYSFGVTMWQLNEERFPYEEIQCNEVVAYNVVKKQLRPDSVTTVTTLCGPRTVNLSKKDRCMHGSLQVVRNNYLNSRFETATIENALKNQGISVAYTNKAFEAIRSSISFLCTQGKLSEEKHPFPGENTLFYEHFRIPNHMLTQVHRVIQTLYSKCWLSDPSSRPDAATVRTCIRQTLEKVVQHKFAN